MDLAAVRGRDVRAQLRLVSAAGIGLCSGGIPARQGCLCICRVRFETGHPAAPASPSSPPDLDDDGFIGEQDVVALLDALHPGTDAELKRRAAEHVIDEGDVDRDGRISQQVRSPSLLHAV